MSGAPCSKNGPSMSPSVALPCASLLMVIVSIDSPSTSDSRMNSCRLSVVMFPQSVRNWIAELHSASVWPTFSSRRRPGAGPMRSTAPSGAATRSWRTRRGPAVSALLLDAVGRCSPARSSWHLRRSSRRRWTESHSYLSQVGGCRHAGRLVTAPRGIQQPAECFPDQWARVPRRSCSSMSSTASGRPAPSDRSATRSPRPSPRRRSRRDGRCTGSVSASRALP